jgi:hypothetical protein
LGLDDKYQPTDGARPPFLIPPQFGRLTIDAAFLAALPAFIKTMIYTTKR